MPLGGNFSGVAAEWPTHPAEAVKRKSAGAAFGADFPLPGNHNHMGGEGGAHQKRTRMR